MISFKTLTYGRVAFLEEMLFSYINQEDIEDSEMVIVNDYPLQTLIFDHPKVRIFNLKSTFKTIGEKENFTIENCKGDLIATCDDDDIALPRHLKTIRKYFTPGTNMLHWGRAVYYNEPTITSIGHLGNSGMIFSKDAWEKAGRSPIMNAGGDSIFRDKVHELGNILNVNPLDEEISWFYRWSLPQNGGVYHQSGAGFDQLGKPNIVQRHSQHIERLRQVGLVPTGDIVLKPRWDQDYYKLLQDYLKTEKRL